MNRDEMQRYLRMLADELHQRDVTGEIVLAGGAVMLLVVGNRPVTKDIDAYFAVGSRHIREAARAIAEREHLPPDWINDGVKGFFYSQPPTTLWFEYPGLRVYVASPDYVLAMKAVAGRPEDIPDIEALAAYLHLTRADDILAVVSQYVPESLVTPRTQYLIQGLFE